VAGAVGLGEVVADGGNLWWSESRPDEGGRTVVVRRTADGTVTDAVPSDLVSGDADVRTGVHEYGGGAWWVADGVLVHSRRSDERLVRSDPDGAPDAVGTVLTPEPAVPRGLRYADGRTSPDGRWYVCVREDHGDATGEPANELVAVPMDGSAAGPASDGPGEVRVLVSGPDFVSSPRPSPDGSRLAWIQWNHPDLPWDDTQLWVGDLSPDGTLSRARRLDDARGESFFQPEWFDEETLLVVTDRDDWWHLHRVEVGTGGFVQLTAGRFEVATPQWVFGQSRYAVVGEDIWFARREAGVDRLGVVHPDGTATDVEPLGSDPRTRATSIGSLARFRNGIVAVAASWTSEPTLVAVEADESTVLRAPRDLAADVGVGPDWLPIPEAVEFPTGPAAPGSETAHALVYPPTSPDNRGPDGERPPLVVLVHGGPTGSVRTQLQLAVAYWTSRGFAVADVDYRGSTGYGRPYRHRLRGGWGVLDVEDCVAVARHLAAEGRVDGDRLAIRGGSAGGFTVLAALAFHDAFTAGASRYGIADLAALAAETHKFEARYLDRLVGEWPADEAIYRDRSPIHHVGRLSTPLLLLQGLEDRVVPPSQAHAMADALRDRGVPFALVEFPDEGHGFRRAENVVRALEAEMAFFSRCFGFDPADDLPSLAVEG
jgi:dipeptidyl aminopeptidase/acylaminoacyl peptidase